MLASLAIPGTQPGFTQLSQQTASPGYGLSYTKRENGGQRAEWSIRQATGEQALYYKVDMLLDPYAGPTEPNQPPAVKSRIEKKPYANTPQQPP